ncbi:hypothetical protein ADUPG1_007108 [Aduncisulcus paluster]|uniref:Uncharacterized protein n=1 Tax=Aduncisulcus paluster TaxID=2918883 RepID=A0ABQ5KNR4_9EUKA|nr:hypothetical protein ADUPG1_007108 [Aduncisulcus paluster]
MQFSISELETLIASIKVTSSQHTVISLFEESFYRLKATFDEIAPSSCLDSATIISNRNLSTLSIKCLSLFTKHSVISSSDASISDEDIHKTVILLDTSSFRKIFDNLLRPMIRIESVLANSSN